MKSKFCMLLIAIAVFVGAIVAVGCESASASERVSVSDKQKPSAVQAAVSIDVAPDVIQSNVARVTAAGGYERDTTFTTQDSILNDESNYQFTVHRERWRPPSFSGLGADKFARGKV